MSPRAGLTPSLGCRTGHCGREGLAEAKSPSYLIRNWSALALDQDLTGLMKVGVGVGE
jgi:hypothetical protein